MTRFGWPLNQNAAPEESSLPPIRLLGAGTINGGGACPLARKVTVWKPSTAKLTDSPTWIRVAVGKKPLNSRCATLTGFGGPAVTGATRAIADVAVRPQPTATAAPVIAARV